jgi:hypothetical protein
MKKKTKIAFLTLRICCFWTTHIFEQLLFLNNGDFSQIFFTAKETKRFFFTFLDNRMTTKILNDCVLFLNNYYDDCFVFEQPTFLIHRFYLS